MSIEERLNIIEAKLGINNSEMKYGRFWDEEDGDYILGKIDSVDDSTVPFCTPQGNWYKHFKPFTSKELADLRALGFFLG